MKGGTTGGYRYLLHRGSRAEEGGASLVLLHGLGSHEEDLIGLAPTLERLTVVTLRAPRAYGPGYAWFHVDWTERGPVADEEEAALSRDALSEALPVIQKELGLNPERFYLGGFSQGSMMTLATVHRTPERFAGAVLMSGRLIRSTLAEPGEALRRVPFLVQHGTMDEVLPVAEGRAIRDYLAPRIEDFTYREYAMGHAVSEPSLQDLAAWFDARLGPA